MLQQALMDKDWALRMRAATLLRQQGVTDVDASMRPAPSDIVVGDKRVLASLTPQYSPHAYIDTDKGTIEVELAILEAPLTVENFVTLARKGYFNGLTIHRVVPNFVIQGGSPGANEYSGYKEFLRDEIAASNVRGSVGLSIRGRNTGDAQFYVNLVDNPRLDGGYTVFARVFGEDMDTVDRIQEGDVMRSIDITPCGDPVRRR